MNGYDPHKDLLTLSSVDMEIEFEFATWDALQTGAVDFEFQGYVVDTSKAVDVVQEIQALRTYH